MIVWLRRNFIGNRNPLVWMAVFLIALLMGAAGYSVISHLQTPKVMLRLGDGIFTAVVARTEPQLEKGLSGTESLEQSQAMLFVFPHDDKWGIWMKDMHYPIDIIWLDANKQVMQIVHHASPDTYPDQKFIPSKPARYVVEVPADTAKGKAITVGTIAVFDDVIARGDK